MLRSTNRLPDTTQGGREPVTVTMHPRGYLKKVPCGLTVKDMTGKAATKQLLAHCGDECIRLSDDALMFRAQQVASRDFPLWTPKDAGCRGVSLLVKYLPGYVSYGYIMTVSVCHAFYLGLVKDLWTLLIDGPATKGVGGRPSYQLRPKALKALKSRASCLTLTCDQGRDYRCIVADRGYWVMENWSTWAEFASVALLQPFTVGDCDPHPHLCQAVTAKCVHARDACKCFAGTTRCASI